MTESVNSKQLFSIVIEEKKDALVLFSAKWCADCRGFEPAWEKWTAGRDGSIYLIDIERNGPEWDEWNIDEIPTVAAYSNGVELDRAHGLITAAELNQLWKKLASH